MVATVAAGESQNEAETRAAGDTAEIEELLFLDQSTSCGVRWMP
jgi:hypothetical protein